MSNPVPGARIKEWMEKGLSPWNLNSTAIDVFLRKPFFSVFTVMCVFTGFFTKSPCLFCFQVLHPLTVSQVESAQCAWIVLGPLRRLHLPFTSLRLRAGFLIFVLHRSLSQFPRQFKEPQPSMPGRNSPLWLWMLFQRIRRRKVEHNSGF